MAAVLALALGGLVAGAALLAAVERDGRAAVDADLTSRAAGLAREVLRPERFGGGRRPGGPPDEGLLAGAGTFVQLAIDGQVVRRRGDVPTDPPALPGQDGLRTVPIAGRDWRSLTVAAGQGGRIRVQILSTLAPVEDRVARIRRQVLGLGVLTLVLTGALAWLLTGVAVRPLARLRDGAARISGAEDLAAPLAQDEGPDEVRSLARALNEMLARLHASAEATARALQATRRFAADAGHELRTPLTGLRATLDTLDRNPDLPEEERRALIRETLAEQERMVHLLEGLQALARGEAAESLPREDVEIADLVDAAVYDARRRHPGTLFELADHVADASVRGWPGGLRLVADNLLANAALHGGRGGGRVVVGLERDGGTLVLRVEDDGPGIPEGERASVLEPFARGRAAAAPGTGLGLAIVAQQVALHGGTLTLEDSALGGLAVEVRLPGAPAPAPQASLS
jgi:two-component system, OmpR family, sensor histidine kinase PrrB